MKKLLILFIFLSIGCNNNQFINTKSVPQRTKNVPQFVKEMIKNLDYINTIETEDHIVDRYTTSLNTPFFKIYEFGYDRDDLSKCADITIIDHPEGSCLNYNSKSYVKHTCGCYTSNGFNVSYSSLFPYDDVNKGHRQVRYYYDDNQVRAEESLNLKTMKDGGLLVFKSSTGGELSCSDYYREKYGLIHPYQFYLPSFDFVRNVEVTDKSVSYYLTDKDGNLISGYSKPSSDGSEMAMAYFEYISDTDILYTHNSGGNAIDLRSLKNNVFTQDTFNEIYSSIKPIALTILNNGGSIRFIAEIKPDDGINYVPPVYGHIVKSGDDIVYQVDNN